MDYYLDNTKVFKALGDPKRAMIVDMLSCGELCACNISRNLIDIAKLKNFH